MARNITDDLNGLRPSAWVTWQVVDSSDGWGFLRNPQLDEAATAYIVNKKYSVMAQYSRFLRPGDRIIALDDPNSVAAWDAKTGKVVVITRNGNDTDRRVRYDLSRFTKLGAMAAAYRTSPAEDLAALPPVALTGGRFTAMARAKSVTTYVFTGAAFGGAPGFDYRDRYVLVNQKTDLAALPALGAPPSAAPVVLGEIGGARAQWRLLGLGGGAYKVINRGSGLALDVNHASTLAGSDLIQYADSGADNQAWRLEPAPDGAYTLVNRHSGLVLGARGDGAGAALVQQRADGGLGQEWRLVGPLSRGAGAR